LSRSGEKTRDRAKEHPEVLARLRKLTTLSLCGKLREPGFLAPLRKLRGLTLARTGLGGLAGIEALSGLRHLRLLACGAADLQPLAALDGLESLEIWDQRNLRSLAPLTGLAQLRRLWLVSCGATLALPSLAGMDALRVLVIDKLARPDNLKQIAAAPALRCLILTGSPALRDADALRPLAGHPTLEEVRLDSYDEALLRAVRQRYGWKVAYSNYPADRYLK